ncbi:hypothetical protein SETIT_3G343700v2 [Setaria italica]|uniref:Cathepsin propeptide inhibitor domain-containing protein n=1 Tax=Setaria italica TaxID=4555 RepID=K3ZCC6_SETIT|nr:hypothetical protein SETIT_3G343700v2 [Setaria italica]
MASAAAARSTAAVAARAAAARHVASGTGRSSPLFPRRGFAAVTTTTTLPAAWTRPLPSHAAAAPMPSATRLDLASEEAMWALYERWCAFYGVKRSRDDMLRRFGAFKEMARRIHEFNKSGASYTMKLGERADLTAEERDRFYRSNSF